MLFPLRVFSELCYNRRKEVIKLNERIRELRKMKEMNQTEFGAKLGLSQRAVANMETTGGTVTDRNFNAICKAFNVNPKWLRDGVGDIFVETREAIIQSVVDEFGLSENEAVLMRSFLELEPEYRVGVLKWAEKFTSMMSSQMGVAKLQREEMPEHPTPEQKREIVNREIDAEIAAREKEPASSVSISTIGFRKKFGNGS